jgi:hypothetical protein
MPIEAMRDKFSTSQDGFEDEVSDASGGPNWWQASNGIWYPPELHPSYKQGKGGSATSDVSQ